MPFLFLCAVCFGWCVCQTLDCPSEDESSVNLFNRVTTISENALQSSSKWLEMSGCVKWMWSSTCFILHRCSWQLVGVSLCVRQVWLPRPQMKVCFRSNECRRRFYICQDHCTCLLFRTTHTLTLCPSESCRDVRAVHDRSNQPMTGNGSVPVKCVGQ